MTVKEELRELIETLTEDAAAEALSLIRVLVAERETEDDEDAEAILARAKPFTFDDPLWEIAGMIDDDGPADVSSNKYKYLAEAYEGRHES